ncbi:MAG: 4-hydroxybenzoate octaprenyltransferase [Phycisphaerae bacterium]|nr:4-hydroxybenzoate octaprenyltransferase [Phycisphaerae bacterium]
MPTDVLRSARHATAVWAEMIKFAHSVFALPYALLATFLAARPGLPTATQLLLILICMVGARSAAMTFNRLVDQRIDAENPRTRGRPLPSGTISRTAAWSFFAASGGLFLLGCAGFWLLCDNPWPFGLSLPVLALLCAYSLAKYVTRWSHLILGAAIALSPVAAWIAINPHTLSWRAALLMLAVTCWIAGFDLIYACQDERFDRRRGLFSLPATMGVAAALRLARVLHLLTALALISVGLAHQLGWLYYLGVACVAALLAYENAIVSPRDLSRVDVAFFTINGVVGVVLGVLGVLDIVLT